FLQSTNFLSRNPLSFFRRDGRPTPTFKMGASQCGTWSKASPRQLCTEVLGLRRNETGQRSTVWLFRKRISVYCHPGLINLQRGSTKVRETSLGRATSG